MPALSSIPVLKQRSCSGLVHIVSTSSLAGDEVLAHFSDGSSAIYEMEELEKLRPVPKKVFPAQGAEPGPQFAEVA